MLRRCDLLQEGRASPRRFTGGQTSARLLELTVTDLMLTDRAPAVAEQRLASEAGRQVRGRHARNTVLLITTGSRPASAINVCHARRSSSLQSVACLKRGDCHAGMYHGVAAKLVVHRGHGGLCIVAHDLGILHVHACGRACRAYVRLRSCAARRTWCGG